MHSMGAYLGRINEGTIHGVIWKGLTHSELVWLGEEPLPVVTADNKSLTGGTSPTEPSRLVESRNDEIQRQSVWHREGDRCRPCELATA